MDNAALIGEYRKKWNVPDWKSKPAYEYTRSLNPHQLRWEFLRRINFYRAAWDSGDYASDLDFSLTEMYAPWVRGDELPDGFAFFDSDLVGTILDLSVIRQSIDSQGSDESFEAALGERILDLVNHGYVLIPFDPAISIQKQMKAATNALIRHKEAKGRSRINSARVRTYDDLTLLRALDADNESNVLAEHPDAESNISASPLTDIARIIFDRGLNIGDTSEANAAHTYFINAVKYAHRMAARPIFDLQ